MDIAQLMMLFKQNPQLLQQLVMILMKQGLVLPGPALKQGGAPAPGPQGPPPPGPPGAGGPPMPPQGGGMMRR